jgi:hypothetical protein
MINIVFRNTRENLKEIDPYELPPMHMAALTNSWQPMTVIVHGDVLYEIAKNILRSHRFIKKSLCQELRINTKNSQEMF